MKAQSICIALLFVMLAACSPGSDLPELPPRGATAYRLDTADRVNIIVFGQETLSGLFTVNDSGLVSMPLIGAVPARDLTVEEFQGEIERRLADGYLVNPSVSVQIDAYRPIYVLGEVSSPGQFPYQPGMTVLTAVSIAGGFTYRAQEDYVSITRQNRGAPPTEARASRDTLVQPGDVINVFERFF
ncbi:MAG: polysaccharide export protein [Rhodospirillaceae bacterium]|nr:polysaccharide export protein [Rhodospirillaceae bacterium]